MSHSIAPEGGVSQPMVRFDAVGKVFGGTSQSPAFTALSEARLILTDDLIRDALKADKAAREAANENFESEDDA